VVICLERGADLPLTVSYFIKIQIGLTFLIPAHPGSPGKRAVNWVCVFVANVCIKLPNQIIKLLTDISLVLFMTTRIGVMSCGTAGPLGSVPGTWTH